MEPKICLALGGGAARGLAHLGVLKVFEDAQVQIDMIAGTSLGAMIGGLYASPAGCRYWMQQGRAVPAQFSLPENPAGIRPAAGAARFTEITAFSAIWPT